MTKDTTYYWRIDEVNASEAGSPWLGTVWSFTATPTQWFGYFHAHTVVDGSGVLSETNWGDALPSVGSYTNLNHVFPSDIDIFGNNRCHFEGFVNFRQ